MGSFLDNTDFQAILRRADRSGVPAGPAADDHHVVTDGQIAVYQSVRRAIWDADDSRTIPRRPSAGFPATPSSTQESLRSPLTRPLREY